MDSSKSLVLSCALFESHITSEEACDLARLETRYQVQFGPSNFCVLYVLHLDLSKAAPQCHLGEFGILKGGSWTSRFVAPSLETASLNTLTNHFYYE